ncbi:hypothetical protein [Paenibacillus sp. DCT19]|uniref:hypothetical protein n=1 Tax=Paenibacillus sp. DCT19 TaxID=2211212 RepID=UPI000FE1FB0D|nr:hypothetical protein [Paenibacillus sp. DCT19]
MPVYEHSERALYHFHLAIQEEANILSQFIDTEHDLLFPYFECNFSAFPEDRDYIEKRTRIKSKENVFNLKNSFVENETVYWYRPNDLQDLMHILHRDRITYRCIVLPKNSDLDHIRFKLFAYEHAEYQGEETRALFIDENTPDDYLVHVHPKVIQIISKIK